jgi:hypothetical protein
MFSSNTTQESGGYEIQRSLRFNLPDASDLSRTPASAGNRRTWTWSAWVKRSGIGVGNASYMLFTPNGNNNDNWFGAIFVSFDQLVIEAWTFNYFVSSGVYRDPAAWYHVVLAWDTTQATDSERFKVYINGQAAPGSYNYPSQNFESGLNSTVLHKLGQGNRYMTEVNFIDGQALTPSSFGEYNADTGVWQPKRYAGSYGTNGFYLNFSDNSNTTAATLGADYSGNGNNWTPNNFSVSAGAGNDSLVDSPTNFGVDTGVGGSVRGNYCTMNPLALGASASIANGNLDVSYTTGGRTSTGSTFGLTSGKWYWEATITATNLTNTTAMIGLTTSSSPNIGENYPGQTSASWGYYGNDGTKYNAASGTSYGASYGLNDVIGVAFDADAGTLTFYKNGTSQGTAFSGLTSGPYYPDVGNGASIYTFTAAFNFGQRPFAYTAPSGFKALNTQNLPTPTIGATPATQAGKFFNPVLYTGNRPSTQSITGVGFQPDWVWIKQRSGAGNNTLTDVVRGVNSQLFSNTTDAEQTNTDVVTAFNADGFSLGSNQSGNSSVNVDGSSYVAWNWKANGAGVTNTAGSITSTVSANTTSGFSVVTYGGNGANSTIGHGLGAAPRMMIVKRRGAADAWIVYHASVGNTGILILNTTSATTGNSTFWNNTSPTSTVFTVGTTNEVNANGSTYVAYCFSEVPGYSRFGSYTGNGSADGPFVFCGFRPKYIMRKNISAGTSGDNWYIIDVSRAPYNASANVLAANQSFDEATFGPTNYAIDILSNGFKIRDDSTYVNASGNIYIFAAFAEAPQKFSLAR